MENQESKSITAQLITDLAAALIISDVCLACSTPLGETYNLALLKVSVQRGDRVYPFIGISLCGACAKEQDFAKIRRGTNYWLSEGKLDLIC